MAVMDSGGLEKSGSRAQSQTPEGVALFVDATILLAACVAGILGGCLGAWIADHMPTDPPGVYDFGFALREKFANIIGCLLGPVMLFLVPTSRPRPWLRGFLCASSLFVLFACPILVIIFFHFLLR
jgi:hypothetical protein